MATDLRSPPEPSVTSVVKGIVDDFQTLMQQQVALFRAEVMNDWRKTKEAAWPTVVGAGIMAISGIMLSLMLVHLVHWGTSPAGSDPASIPLWGCYGLVGALFAVCGAGLIYFGITRFQSFNPLPEESAQALKENVQWLTNKR